MTNFPLTSDQKLWGRIMVGLMAIWIIVVSFGAQLTVWAGPILGLEEQNSIVSVGGAAAQALLIGAPLLILALTWRTPRYRAIFQSWLLAAGFVLLLAPTRWFLPTQGQTVLALQIGAMLLYLVFVTLLGRNRQADGPRADNAPPFPAVALAMGALFAYPWLAWGALGSWLDVILCLAAGLLFGRGAGIILRGTWLRSLALDTRGPVRDRLTGGGVAGILALIMASAFSFNGVQLLLMIALPALGWAAVGLVAAPEPESAIHHWRGPAWLIGLAAATILLLIDPDGLALQVQDALLGWSFQAVGLAVLIGWLLGLLMLLMRNRLRQLRTHRIALICAGALWVIGGLIYVGTGQPGLYGDRLFVILKDQADVSAAAAMTDYDARRQFVYTTLVEQANSSQANLRQTLDQFGIAYTPYYLVNALEIEGGSLLQLWLATRPEVDRVLPSPILRPLAELPQPMTGDVDPPTTPQWNLTNIGADRVWEEFGVTGAGIVIGQSDSGVQLEHPELMGSYRGQNDHNDYNWFDPWYGSQAPTDIGGHGTHTLGSVLGKTVGVAPGATWFGCANLARNLGNAAFYLDCMQFMLAPFPLGGNPFADGDPTQAAYVTNNSWGCPQAFEGCDSNALLPAVRAMRAAGIFMVASAGNEGPACSTIDDAIATYDEVFSVGAIDQFGNLASFSSTGPVDGDGSGRIKPDLVAPGVQVLSALPDDTYAELDGTSMAGPHVAGVVALIWSANPALIGNIERTEQILIESARPFTGTLGSVAIPSELVDAPVNDLVEPPSDSCVAQTDTGVTPNNVAGYGVVDAYAAVKLALEK